jgi:Methyltransferase domain
VSETTPATQDVGSSSRLGRGPLLLREGARRYRERSALRRSDPRFRRALELATAIEGFTAPAELSLLYHLSLATPGSTVVLASAAVDTGRVPVVAVDPHTAALGIEREEGWDTRHQFLSNIERAGLRSDVRLLHMTSLEAAAGWDGSAVRMLFVDGWHSEEAVLADVHAWAPYFADPHCVVFDDFLPFASVRSAVRKLTATGTISGEGLIVGKMVAFGPPEVMRSVPAPPGARMLVKLNDRVLDWAIKHLAT